MNSPFREEWLKCQKAHLIHVIEQEDINNFVTLYILLRKMQVAFPDVPLLIDGPLLEEKCEAWEYQRALRAGEIKKQKKRKTKQSSSRKPSKHNYWYTGEKSKEGKKMNPMFNVHIEES